MTDSNPDFDPIAFVNSQSWTFAKTMPQWPHEYIVRGKGNDPEEFNEFTRLTRREGRIHRFGKRKTLRWVDGQGYIYWTMGGTIDFTTVMNRCRLEEDVSTPMSIDDARLDWAGPNWGPNERPEQ